MYMIAISLLGAMLLALSLATTEPQAIATRTQVTADTWAANFWAYRDALSAYQYANPGAPAGPVNPAFFTPPLGYGILNQTANLPQCHSLPQWSNSIQGGVLYTYSSEAAACLPAGAIDAIANRHGRSLMLGIEDNTGGTSTMSSMFMLTATKSDGYTQDPATTSKVSFPLPTAAGIPAGALVVIGN